MKKKLIWEIYLFDTCLKEAFWKKSKKMTEIEQGAALNIRQEKTGLHRNKIQVVHNNGEILGYVSRKDSMPFCKLLEAEKNLTARVRKIEQGNYMRKIHMDIFLEERAVGEE